MKNKYLYLSLNILLYILSSVGIFYFFYYFFTDVIVNSAQDIDVTFPALILLILPIYTFFLFHFSLRTSSKLKLYKSLIIHCSILAILSIYVIIHLIFTIYFVYDGNAINRQFTNFFPLDFIIYALLALVIFIIILSYSVHEFKKIRSTNNLEENNDQRPLIKINLPKKGKLPYLILIIVYLLFAMYFFMQGLLGIFLIDYTMTINLLGSFVILISCFIPTILIVIYYFGYLRMKEEKKNKFYFISVISTSSSFLILLILYVVQLCMNKMFIIESLQAFFPIDFAASLNLGPLILFLLMALPILISICIYLVRFLQKNKQK